jgi:hypothetical protein
MRRRDEIIALLVAHQPISMDERRSLGGFVTGEEIARAIEGALRRGPRFPDGNREGSRIVVSLTGATLEIRRRNAPSSEHFESVRAAINRYIEVEIGPSCGGVRVR